MFELAVTVGFFILFVVGVIIGIRAQRQRQRHADEVFKQTMLSLEEKAKREGTFRVSYFEDFGQK